MLNITNRGVHNLSVIQRSLLNVSCQNISYSYYIHLLACTSESAMSAPFHWISMKFSYIVSLCTFLNLYIHNRYFKTCEVFQIKHSTLRNKILSSPCFRLRTFCCWIDWASEETLQWCVQSVLGMMQQNFNKFIPTRGNFYFFFFTFCKTLISETFGAKI